LDALMDWLGMTVEPRTPRPDTKGRVLARALLARSRRQWLLAVAAGLVLVAGAATWSWFAMQRLENQRADLGGRLAALQDTLSLVRSAGTRVLQIPVSTNGQAGAVTIFADTMTHRWLVTCHHLAPNEPGQVYQLWFLTADGPRSAVIMPMDSDRPMVVALDMPKEGGAVTGAAMSIEPTPGSAAPTGPMVFHLSL
jgi:anti-sigma-K factor RskA